MSFENPFYLSDQSCYLFKVKPKAPIKNKFSSTSILILFIVALVTSFVFNACKKDETKNCNRDCFIGSWYAKDVHLGYSDSYNVTIYVSSSDPKGIEIMNFGDNGGTLLATVEDVTFNMPHQDVTQFVSYEGSGILDEDGDTLNVTYKVQSGAT